MQRSDPTVIALVGNPNCGKSTLFNELTGSHSATVNAPGTTVELHRGRWRSADGHSNNGRSNNGRNGEGHRNWLLIDLPGTYSLNARSPDEQVAADVVIGRLDLVGDAKPPRTAGGLPGARQRSTTRASCPKCANDSTRVPMPANHRHVGPDGGGHSGEGTPPDLVIALLDATALARSLVLLAQVKATGVSVVAAVTMLDVAAKRSVAPDLVALSNAAGVPVVAVNPRTNTGTEALTEMIQRTLETEAPHLLRHSARSEAESQNLDVAAESNPDAQFTWVQQVLSAAVPSTPATPVRSRSDQVDSVLLHPVAGVLIFLAAMWALLEITAMVATPLVTAVGDFFAGSVTDLVIRAFSGWAPNWLISLFTDGILTGVGTVLSFTPLLALVFFAIGVLEDSGYLARAAFIADRALRNIGLDGRAMMPLVVGFGCNVPAITATKAMPDSRQRLLAGLLIPLAACPARLTVFVLIAGVFFPNHVGTVVFGLYLVSILLIVLGGLLLRATAFRDLAISRPLVLALPAYQSPRIGWLLRSAGSRVAAFVRGAGGTIAGVLIAVWILTAIPVTSGYAFGQVDPVDSLYGRVAAATAPVLRPAGLDDWRISSSLITGFVAKEVVVGNLAQTFGTSDPTAADYVAADDVPGNTLSQHLHAALNASSGGHPQAAAAAFLIIVLAYTPCIATVAEQKRNYGWRWTLISLFGQLALAWLLGVSVFQVGRLLA